MAGPGSFKQTPGVLDTWGGRFSNTPDYTGVKAYVVGGELLDPKAFGCPNRIEFVTGSMSISGTYRVICKPNGTGFCSWNVLWYVVSSGAEVSVNTDLSAETVKLFGYGV